MKKTILILTLLCGNLPAADKPKGEDQFLTRVRQLTLDGRRSGEGYFAPDGKHIIFQSEREKHNPFYQIYTMDMQSGDVVRVSPGHGKTHLRLLPPQQRRSALRQFTRGPQGEGQAKGGTGFSRFGQNAPVLVGLR